MALQVQTTGNMAVVKLTNDSFNDATIESVSEQLFFLVDKQGRNNLYLDFCDMQSVPSICLGKLVGLHKKVKDVGGHLALLNVPAMVWEILEITNLHRFLDIRRKEAG